MTTEIKPGYKISISDESVDYDAIESAVKEHNESAKPSEKYWGILIDDGYYIVNEYGEVPEPVVTPDPPEPTIEEIQNEKLNVMSDTCQQLIYNGIDVTLSTGEKHFSLEVADQSNIDGVFNAVVLGATEYPYHADGEPCAMYIAADIITLYVAYKSFVTKQTTYCNAMRQWIKRTEDKETLNTIEYGATLPDDLKASVEEILTAANKQVQAIIAKLTEEK